MWKLARTADGSVPFSVLDSLGEGITIADASGRIVFSNKAADRILGTAASGGAPDDWADHYGVFLPDERTPFPTEAYPLVRALAGEPTDDVELFIRNARLPAGVLIAATGRPLRDEGGGIVDTTAVFRDVTALRPAERALKATNAALEETRRREAELAAFVVHDLKSPLAAILANATALIERARRRGQDVEGLMDIHEGAQLMHRLVLDLLDLHQAGEGHLVPTLAEVRVDELFAEIAAAMAPRRALRGLRIETSEALGGLPLRADRGLLLRVVSNLVDNCIKYGPRNGTIRLGAHPGAPGRALITVEDEGPGVPEALRRRIFEKFAPIERHPGSAREGSHGLGLRFCQIAVEAHGGTIWVEDNAPRGARFCVELPGLGAEDPAPAP